MSDISVMSTTSQVYYHRYLNMNNQSTFSYLLNMVYISCIYRYVKYDILNILGIRVSTIINYTSTTGTVSNGMDEYLQYTFISQNLIFCICTSI